MEYVSTVKYTISNATVNVTYEISNNINKGKGKVIPLKARCGPEGG